MQLVETSPWLASVLAAITAYVKDGLPLCDAVARAVRDGFERSGLRRRGGQQPDLDIEEE